MTPHLTELLWGCGLLLGVVITAALVNRLRPGHRPRLRRLVILFVLYVFAFGGGYAFEAADLGTWATDAFIAMEILRAFTLVSVTATLVFSVVLPSTGVMLPMIASDLLVGLGYVASALGILAHHGLDPTGALVSGAVISAVLAISLQSTLGNILGGVALQLDGSIHEGDWIQLENGKQGRVRAVRWRHTIVETRDWSTIVVPNAQLLATNITILGKRDGVTVPQRMWVWFNVDFRFAPSRVVAVVTDAINAAPIDNVASDPKPNVVCMDFTKEMRESFATYAVRYWINDLASDDPTNSRVRARIYTGLRRAGIPLAVPAHTALVEIHDESRRVRRLERESTEHLAALKTVHLFQSLTQDELRTLADGMSHVVHTAGEIITRQGAVAHWLYVMTSGKAEIRTLVDPDGAGPKPAVPLVVAQIQAPDFFGEMGLMTGEPRSADVIALTDVDCFRLGKETFERVLLARPDMAEELSKKLAERRVELIAVRDGLDAAAMRAREKTEREWILGGIKSFFGL
ncbi:MAG: Potassium efflux system KefA protein / Small-conductance mechanosensitive channel [Myxococcales bacterium]|nr:Potassium efflux system KefA protein / Small-conductance mechanosensitive channel [Myxococcales bacterium]